MPEGSPTPVERSAASVLQRLLPARLTSLHYLGGLALVFLALQFLTGILLAAYYRPSVDEAHTSVRILTDEVRFGWLVRFLHHWGTHVVIVLLSVHAMRVYFSRAYRVPRRLNWIVGIALLALTLALAFTGTLLPWDQYAFWYVDSARAAVAAVPFLGNVLLGLAWGGWEIGEEVLLRFYALHIGVLPSIVLVLLSTHLWLVWAFGIAAPGGATESEEEARVPFYPDFLLNLLIAALLVSGLLLTAAVLYPPALSPPADPLSPYADVRPPWYLLPVRETLTALPGWLAAVAILVFATLIFLVPFLDRRPVRGSVGLFVQRGLGLLAIGGWVVLGILGYLR